MLNLKTVVLVLLAVTLLSAEMPVDNLGMKSVGVSYTFEMNGFTLENGPKSTSMLHMGGLHYAPIPYLMFVLKFGAGDAEIEHNSVTTEGEFGFAINGGISLYTPEFANILKFTGGSYFTTHRSEFDVGYLTVRNFRSHVGLRVDALPIVNFEAGMKHNFIFGKSNKVEFGDMDIENDNQFMGYLQFTLHNPTAGAFVTLGGEFSPEFSTDGSGIYDGVLSLSIGTVLSHQKRAKFSRD